MRKRIVGAAAAHLDGRQYEYAGGRSTAARLLEMHDFVREAFDGGHYVFLVSVDVGGAFDKVSHIPFPS